MPTVGLLLEERLGCSGDGRFVSFLAPNESTWNRYLDHFDRLVVIARCTDVANLGDAAAGWTIDDPRISVHPLPYYVGVGSLAARTPVLLWALNKAVKGLDAVVVKAPGPLSLLTLLIRKRGRPLRAVQLVGDPDGVFGTARVGGAAAWVYRAIAVEGTRRLCMKADAVSYVTRRMLQGRYPAASHALTASYSDVSLEAADYQTPDRRSNSPKDGATIFAAGTLETMYKGPAILVDSVRRLRAQGLDVRVRWAGDGRRRPEVEALISAAGLQNSFELIGYLSRPDVIREMRACDIYVQPSLTEGLPRAVIEAGAQSAPIIATNVGGIPELIQLEWQVPPGDACALAEALGRMIRCPAAQRQAAQQNYAMAQNYERGILKARNDAYLDALRTMVDARSAR